MRNYYRVLNLASDASQAEIKRAFKALALKYHPDRNQGNLHAENKFKRINEAYQTLSDSNKKEKYDLVYRHRSRSSTYQPYQTYTNPSQSKRGYAQRRSKRNVYVVDEKYYREQLWTIAIILIIIVLVTSATAINNYYAEKRAEEEAIIIKNKLQQASLYFSQYEYDSTFSIIIGLMRQYPMESIYSKYRDEYVKKIYLEGIHSYHQQKYIKAIHELNIAKTYIKHQDLNIWYVIGECHEALESYTKAISAFEYVFIRESSDIGLAMRIGDLYIKLNDKRNALNYYSTAKDIFKEQQSSIYGNAFELVVKPQLLDSSYFYIFKKRGALNYAFSNYEEAITDYNWALFLHPEFTTGYKNRAECWIKIGNNHRACLDLKQAYQRGDLSVLSRIRQYCAS